MGVGPDGLHSRHWLRRGRHRPIRKRCLRPHLPLFSTVLVDISARAYTSGGRSYEKSRLTCLAQVGGHPRAPLHRDVYADAIARGSVKWTHGCDSPRDVISTTTRRGRLYARFSYLRCLRHNENIYTICARIRTTYLIVWYIWSYFIIARKVCVSSFILSISLRFTERYLIQNEWNNEISICPRAACIICIAQYTLIF